MKRTVALVALVVILSGCNAFGPSGSDPVGDTVSPAEVPTANPPRTATATPGGCLVPPPETPTGVTLTPPPEPVAVLGDDGTANGSTIARHHAQALAEYSFRLRADGRSTVWSMPNASAFAYEGDGLGIAARRAYAVDGTLYTLQTVSDGVTVERKSYREGTGVNELYRYVMTGRSWLEGRIGPYNYSEVGTETRNGTRLRVFRDTLDGRILLGVDSEYLGLLEVNSTVYVDDRGIVRYARHVRNTEIQISAGEYQNRTEVQTLRVDGVGSTSLHRPEAFCVEDPDAAVVETAQAPTDVGGREVPPLAADPSATATGPPGTGSENPAATASEPPGTASESAGPGTGGESADTETGSELTGTVTAVSNATATDG